MNDAQAEYADYVDTRRYADGQDWRSIIMAEPEALQRALCAYQIAAIKVATSITSCLDDDASIVTLLPGFEELTSLLSWWCDAADSNIDPSTLNAFLRAAQSLSRRNIARIPVAEFEVFKMSADQLVATLFPAIDVLSRIHNVSSARIRNPLGGESSRAQSPGAPLAATTIRVHEIYDSGITKASKIIEHIPEFAGETNREANLANIRTIISRYRSNNAPKP